MVLMLLLPVVYFYCTMILVGFVKDDEIEGVRGGRQVAFSPSSLSSPNAESHLTRRDTPHNLKNKRVNPGGGAGGVSAEERVKLLLASGGGKVRERGKKLSEKEPVHKIICECF